MARITKPLTNTEVERAKPKEKDYTLSDGSGLYLLIKSNASKLWRFNYYKPYSNPKKRVLLGLGKYPDMTLAQARVQRDEFLALLAQNIDPQDHRKAQEAEKLAVLNNTLVTVATKWREMKSANVREQTIQESWRKIEKHLFPELGSFPITEVNSPKLVYRVVKPIDERGHAETRKRTVQILNEILDYAVTLEMIDVNRCINVNALFSKVKPTHNPTIRPEELPTFLEALRDYHLSTQTKILIKWQLLTMVRPNEASGAQWSEIDFDAKTWTIPAERMKKKREHIIPLSTQCMALLEKMRPMTSTSPYIFQSEIKPKQPMNSQSANRAMKLMGYSGKLTAHGLRSIASTYMCEQAISYEVAEACLAHQVGSSVHRAYNRSNYLELRRPVMQQWGDFVESCSKGI